MSWLQAESDWYPHTPKFLTKNKNKKSRIHNLAVYGNYSRFFFSPPSAKSLLLNSCQLVTFGREGASFFSHIKRFHSKNECNFGVKSRYFLSNKQNKELGGRYYEAQHYQASHSDEAPGESLLTRQPGREEGHPLLHPVSLICISPNLYLLSPCISLRVLYPSCGVFPFGSLSC